VFFASQQMRTPPTAKQVTAVALAAKVAWQIVLSNTVSITLIVSKNS